MGRWDNILKSLGKVGSKVESAEANAILNRLEEIIPSGLSEEALQAARENLAKNNPKLNDEYFNLLGKLGSQKERKLAKADLEGTPKIQSGAYHGSTVDIPKFKSDALGLSTGANSAKQGYFFTNKPNTASDYADLAAEKGVIREGDKITTRLLSDTAELHNDLYDLAKDHAFERDIKLGNIQRQLERNANTQSIVDRLKKEGDPHGRLPKLEENLNKGNSFIEKNRREADEFSKKIKEIDDKVQSQGQNVGQYDLFAADPHIKNYKGQNYRDTTYADEMKNAFEKGKDAVKFKNTYDPADPNNRELADIYAVAGDKSKNIRSKFAAYDPRYSGSGYTAAGAGAIPMADQSNSRFSKILKDNAKAASMGIADAATLGFGDELGGTIAAGLDKGQALLNKLGLADKSPSQIDAELGVESNIYKDVRDNLRKEQKQLSEENPIAYYGGNIAGGMMIPGSSIKSAATLGGAYGLGSSQANDVVGMAKDTALGAGIGAGFAKGLEKVAGAKGVAANAIDKGIQKIRNVDEAGISKLPEFLDTGLQKASEFVKPSANEYRKANAERFQSLLKEKPKVYNTTAKEDKAIMDAIKENRQAEKDAKKQLAEIAAHNEDYKKRALEDAAAQGRDVSKEHSIAMSPEESAEILRKAALLEQADSVSNLNLGVSKEDSAEVFKKLANVLGK